MIVIATVLFLHEQLKEHQRESYGIDASQSEQTQKYGRLDELEENRGGMEMKKISNTKLNMLSKKHMIQLTTTDIFAVGIGSVPGSGLGVNKHSPINQEGKKEHPHPGSKSNNDEDEEDEDDHDGDEEYDPAAAISLTTTKSKPSHYENRELEEFLSLPLREVLSFKMLSNKYFRWCLFVGMCSGILGGMFGTGGPPIMVYFSYLGVDKYKIR